MSPRIALAYAVLVCSVLAAAPAFAQTTPPAPPAAPVDVRLQTVHDKAPPYGFSPAYPDKAGWEARADFLFNQVLVAQGLVPMPPKTPLNPQIYGTIDKDAYTIEKVPWPNGRFVWVSDAEIQKQRDSGAPTNGY
jgi:hypothetical protein